MAPVAVVLVRPLDNPWGKVDEWMVQALAGVGSRPGYVLLLLTSSPGEHSPLTGAPQVPPPPLAPPRSPTTAGATQTRALVARRHPLVDHTTCRAKHEDNPQVLKCQLFEIVS